MALTTTPAPKEICPLESLGDQLLLVRSHSLRDTLDHDADLAAHLALRPVDKLGQRATRRRGSPSRPITAAVTQNGTGK